MTDLPQRPGSAKGRFVLPEMRYLAILYAARKVRLFLWLGQRIFGATL